MAASSTCMFRSSFFSPNLHPKQQSPAKSNGVQFFTPIKATASSTDDAISASTQPQKHRRPADENIREEARRHISSHNFSARYHLPIALPLRRCILVHGLLLYSCFGFCIIRLSSFNLQYIQMCGFQFLKLTDSEKTLTGLLC